MPEHNRTVEHQKLLHELLYAFGSRLDVRCWKRVVGFDEKRKIAYGIPGESDIQGIVAPRGRLLAIEVKTGRARLSLKQQYFKEMIEKFGGIYLEARSVEQALGDFDEKIRKQN